MEGFARDLLRGIDEATAPDQAPGKQLRAEDKETEEIDLTLGLSLGGRFGIDKKGDKLPRSSSAAAAVTTMPPVEVAAPPAPALPRASESPSSVSASLEGAVHGLLGSGTLMSSSSLHASKKRKEAESLNGLDAKKQKIESLNSGACSSISKEAVVVGSNQNHSSGTHLELGLPPRYQGVITTRDSSSALGKRPCSAYEGTALAEEQSSPSSVLSFGGEATRRMTATSPLLPSSSLGPIISAALIGFSSRENQSNFLGRAVAAAARANNRGDSMARRLMLQMPGVFTRGLPNGNRVDGFLYKYRKADDVRIVCLCHGTFLTPTQFVEHAGVGNGTVANPLQHIVVSPNLTL